MDLLILIDMDSLHHNIQNNNKFCLMHLMSIKLKKYSKKIAIDIFISNMV
jgi:hypothetical protein